MRYCRPVLLRAAIYLILVVGLAGGSIWAGESGLNVIVVVNGNSTNSLQLGNDYCELRGVPPQNVLRLTNWTGGAINWTPDQFQTQLLNPLLAMISARNLGEQAHVVVLSMDIPYRITDGNNENSTTAGLFYGFKTNGAPVSGFPSCSLPDNTSNSYAYSELPFSQAPPNTALTNSFLAMLLTDTNLAAAESILRRGVAADFSYPTQTVYLAKTSDPARNVRFVEFDNSVFENQVAGNFAVRRIATNVTAFTNLAGMQTGLATFSLATNAFVPGALADTLTSFGGEIFDNSGQTPLLAFLEGGAAGSYGTVVEPCNYTQKFPDPVDYFYETRGFSVVEAYYQSVLNPFQGLFVGEPLAAPFARPGTAGWISPTNGASLSGPSVLSLAFTAAAANLPLTRVDLFVDGTYFQTLTNLPPAAGNVLAAIVNGYTNTYTVPTNATLAGLATGLAAALNLHTSATHVQAVAFGDRIELQSQDVYVPGSNVTTSVSTAIGSGPALTTGLNATRPTFLDTVATGYQGVSINNTPELGDWLQLTISKTNGTMIFLAVTNTVSGTTVGAMAENLVDQINTNAALAAADGLFASDFFDYDPYGQPLAQFFLYARTSGWPAAQIQTEFITSTNLQALPTGMNPLADNVSDLRPRNHLHVSSGSGTVVVNGALDTTRLSDGWHQFTAVGYEGTSVATQTRVTENVQIQNTRLAATLTAVPAGSNATPGQQLQFTVTAIATNVSKIELFSTGGLLGVVSNAATAVFPISASYLGLGLHPFYAVITDANGNQFQTATVSYRIIPVINLTVSGIPPVLTWSALPTHQYYLEFATNLVTGFQTLATITATNSLMQWPVTAGDPAGFYRVQWGQ